MATTNADEKLVTLRNTTQQEIAILNPDTAYPLFTLGRINARRVFEAKGGKADETAPNADTVEVSRAVVARADVQALIKAGKIAVA